MYYNEAISQRKSNPKELWKFIKSVIPNKRTSTTPPPTIMKDGMLFEESNIYKSGNKNLVNNYCPVSLLPSLS